MQKPRGKMHAAHQVRLIGGQWKRTVLPVMNAPGLRPTPDRVRETLFNWLYYFVGANWDTSTCLDLFAGTGALGFEAASRGAAQVLMVEENPLVIQHLETMVAKLHAGQVQVVRAEALSVLHHRPILPLRNHLTQFDIIFLDPPYEREWLPRLLPLCASFLTEKGLVYAEAEFSLEIFANSAWMAGWEIVRASKAGGVYFHLLKRNN